jgi:amino-acid N-acetyltransferase
MTMDGMVWRIAPAAPADLPAILALLDQAGLPEAGLAQHLATALVARSADVLIGSAALELYGDTALLRSVAVAPGWRGRGIGRALTDAASMLALHHGVRRLVLLTTTAAPWFLAAGWVAVGRDAVDAAARQSVQFTSACPASASVLMRRLDAAGATVG